LNIHIETYLKVTDLTKVVFIYGIVIFFSTCKYFRFYIHEMPRIKTQWLIWLDQKEEVIAYLTDATRPTVTVKSGLLTRQKCHN